MFLLGPGCTRSLPAQLFSLDDPERASQDCHFHPRRQVPACPKSRNPCRRGPEVPGRTRVSGSAARARVAQMRPEPA